jgi:hypothetical protein
VVALKRKDIPSDRNKKAKKIPKPRNLKELKIVQRLMSKREGSQEENVRDYVEEKYPNLRKESEITKKAKTLIRSVNRNKEAL